MSITYINATQAILPKNETLFIQNSNIRKHITINTVVYEKKNKIILKRTIEFKSKFGNKRSVDLTTFDADLTCTDIDVKTTIDDGKHT